MLGHLDETRLLLASLATLFLGSPYQALGKPNHCGTRPTLLNSIFLIFLIYHTGYIYLSPLHHHFPPFFLFCRYPYCIASCDCTFSPVSFKLPLGIYQRCTRLICATTLGIPLEFYIYWHNVAWMMDIPKNIYYILSGSMEIITWMVTKSIQGSLYLSLHIYVMVVIEIACFVL